MQQVGAVNVENLPKIGYYVSKEDKKEKYYKNESHIHKQTPLTGVKAGAHKFVNNILTYFPKGFQGSKNSDFYEFLSLGTFPYVVGSVMMAALYGLCNNSFFTSDKLAADRVFKNAAMGTLLYAVGKWLSPKISHLILHGTTGVNLDMKFVNKKNELPEPGQEAGIVRTQYPDVYGSRQFYRSDLLAKDAEINHDNLYYHDDKIARRAGYKNSENAASNQIAGEKIRGLKGRATALENISKYITAATGVALGFQRAFSDARFLGNAPFAKKTKIPLGKMIVKYANFVKNTFKEAFKQLWNGTDKNVFTKNTGKALVLASILSTTLAWLIPTIGFKTNPETMKSKVDTNKEYEVC